MPSQEVGTRLPLGQKPKSLCAVPPMSCSRAWLGLWSGLSFGSGSGFGFELGLGFGFGFEFGFGFGFGFGLELECRP